MPQDICHPVPDAALRRHTRHKVGDVAAVETSERGLGSLARPLAGLRARDRVKVSPLATSGDLDGERRVQNPESDPESCENGEKAKFHGDAFRTVAAVAARRLLGISFRLKY